MYRTICYIGCYVFYCTFSDGSCKQQTLYNSSVKPSDKTLDCFFAIRCIAFLKWSDSSNYICSRKTDVSNLCYCKSKLRCKCTRRHVALRFIEESWGTLQKAERYNAWCKGMAYGMAWFKSKFNYIFADV